jgi:hypothetical protein
MSASERERNGKGDDESSEYAKLPEDRLKVAPIAQDAFSLCGNDQHASNDGDETDDEEGFKDELGARKREPQRIEQLRDDEYEEYAIKNQERCVNAALLDPLGNEPDGICTDEGDGNHQDASKGDVKRDLETVQHAASATNDAGEDRAEGVVRW